MTLKTMILFMALGLVLHGNSSFALPTTAEDFRVIENLVDGPIKYHNSGLETFSTLGDSGIRYTPYNTMEAQLTELSQKFPNQSQFIHYGKTINGRNLNVLRLEDRNHTVDSPCSRPAIQISGAIHGNEFLGIEDKLAFYFLNNKSQMPGLSLFLDKGGVVYIIPVVNPDGYDNRQRANQNGSDLNRDFDLLPKQEHRFKQPESKSLADYLDTDLTKNNLQLKLALDYHCCVPALITPWSYADLLPSIEDQANYNSIASLEKSLLGFESGNPIQTVGYTAEGTTMDYFYAKYGTIGLAIEGNYGGEVENMPKYIQFWDQVFLEVAQKHWGLRSDKNPICK